ncbi:MAG: hypothetical protein ACRBDI_04490 [Alphaproteobacteria bacterium]
MKKLIFILLLIPAIAALGHDAYFFTQNQDKGFRLTDLGKLWDTYHKESHDQWKSKIDEISGTLQDTIGDVIPQEAATNENLNTETAKEIFADFEESFAQEDGKAGTQELTPPPKEEPIAKEGTNEIKKSIGFLLEQKAVFVFAAIPAILFILNALLCAIFGGRKNKDDGKSGRGKKVKYGRK